MIDRVEPNTGIVLGGRPGGHARNARRAALLRQWDADEHAFLCARTQLPLTGAYPEALYPTWERDGPDGVVLVAALVAVMKQGMDEREFQTVIRALYERLILGVPVDPAAIPLGWKAQGMRTIVAPPQTWEETLRAFE